MEHIIDYHITQKQPAAVTIGNFDGLHLGHRELIRLTKQNAAQKNLKSVVFTFQPHPMFLFKNKEYNALIMSTEEKEYLMRQLGIDLYIEYPFTKEFAAMEPEDFANHLIFDQLNCKVLVVGENYRFGKKAKGDRHLLKELAEKRGVEVIFVPSVLYQEERVSSSRIRKSLKERDIEMANALLGRPYFIWGKVEPGRHLGHTIGFPTANILADPDKLFPPDGVYATKTYYEGNVYSSMTNVGKNPTVDGVKRTIETHIFDFHKTIYGAAIQTNFYHWIRNEVKFSDIGALQNQLASDKETVEHFFAEKKL